MDDTRDAYDVNDETPKPETQQGSFAPVAEPISEPASKPAMVHALEVADYTLGPLDFAAPALSQNHKLSVTDYTIEPLAFSMPVWRYAVLHWRDAGSAFGRPPDIPPSDELALIAKMKRWLIEKQAATFHRLTRDDPAVKEYARKLAADAGIETSDFTLKTQIIRPAFQAIESKT
jgi:hypothetical protein